MSDPKPPDVGRQMQQYVQAISSELPNIIQAIASGIMPLESAMLEAQKALSPAQRELQRQSVLGQAQTESDVLRGPGKDLVTGADELSRLIDPEFFKTRSDVSQGFTDLISSINPNMGLSAGESAELERFLNRDATASGISDTPSASKTIEEGIQFGQAGGQRQLQRQQALSNALLGGSAALPAMRTTDPLQSAIGRQGSITPTGGDTMGLTSQMLGQGAAGQISKQQLDQSRMQGWEKVMSSAPDY